MTAAADQRLPCARRAIDLRATEGAVQAWLEDDFHHFGIRLAHDGARVTDIEGTARRYPRDTCPGAVGILRELVGTPLNARATAHGQYTDMRWHCTHLYDLAGLAIAHAAAGRARRRYDAMVPERSGVAEGDTAALLTRGRTAPVLYRDGEQILNWELEGNTITGPAPCAGISLGRGFRAWTESLPLDEAEAAHVLRRAVLIALGRHFDVNSLPAAGLSANRGACHSYQPDIAARSRHLIGTSRDYSDDPEGPLSELPD